MNEWKRELLSINSAPNHKETLNQVLEAYITSPYANDQHQRTEAIILFNHLYKLF